MSLAQDQKNPNLHHPALRLLSSPHRHGAATFKQIHAQFLAAGLSLHSLPLSLLISSAAAVTHLPHSYPISLLLSSPISSPFLFNTLIISALKNSLPSALNAFSLLLRSRQKPNPHSFPSLLAACGSHPQWSPHGRALHALLLRLDIQPDRFTRTSLLAFYSRNGHLTAACHLFNQIENPDLPTWNSILRASLGEETLAHFQRLQLSGVRPSEITFVALIVACGDLGAISQGLWAHAYIQRSDLEVNRFVGAALIGMYSKCGRLELARQVFDGLSDKDVFCYNAMIRGFAVHGRGWEAVGLFGRMWIEGVGPDGATLLLVMCACAHAGMVDEGRRWFDTMEDVFGIGRRVEHYGCLVDLLGRAGQLKEAEEVVRMMPVKPNAVVYRSLLGACRVHGSMEIGERLISTLVELEPEHGGNYVMLSNMYANIGRWDDVRRVRKAMKDRGIDKNPGSSLVEMDGVVHEFIIGDKSHPRSEEIYAMVDEMGRRLHEWGHMPSTKEVLFDVEEEDKEDALSYHSERLAIAFALVASDSSAPIRIIKNLRVCKDCHSSTKLISWIYRREIVMRDRSRFHHFKNGACSCSDYW